MDLLIDLVPLPYAEAVVALGAAALGLAAGVLGSLAVLQERSLVADALAHAALPGVALAFLLTGVKDPTILLIGAAIAALVGALLMVGVQRTTRLRPDAAIGVVLTGSFCLGIVLLTLIASRAGAQQAGLERYLFGQAAGLAARDVAVMLVLSLVAISIVALAIRPLRAAMFDRSFAASIGMPVRAIEIVSTTLVVAAIVVGLRAVGAILMVAMLVVPAITARQLTDRLIPLLALAGAIGAGVGVTGAIGAGRAGLPTGPVIVLIGTAVAVVAILLAPRRGVLWRALRRRRRLRRETTAAVLIDIETAMHAGPPPTPDELRLATGRGRRRLRSALAALDRAGLVSRDGARLVLTERGAAAAHAALAERRLWTAWLDHGHRLELGDAREPDPRDLRGSLGDDAMRRLMALAGGAR